jgi:hypothetical protein
MSKKQKYKRVPTEFGPDTGFEVKPSPAAPLRAEEEAEFVRLKARLLSEWLEGRVELKLDSHLRRAADDAAALSWVTQYPLLVFPALFEEKANAALLRALRQDQIRKRSLELLAA